MGTRGIKTASRGSRAATLILICVAGSFLLLFNCGHKPLMAQPQSGPFGLGYELQTDENGGITGIIIKGRNAPVKFRGKRRGVYVLLYYADDPGGNVEQWIPLSNTSRIEDDGTFKVEFKFKKSKILNEGVWVAKVSMFRSSPPIEETLEPIIIGSETGKNAQYDIIRKYYTKKLVLFEGTRNEMQRRISLLKAAGRTGFKFLCKGEALKLHVQKLLLFLHSTTGRNATKDAMAAEGLEQMNVQPARADFLRLGLDLPASEFPRYIPTTDGDTPGSVRVVVDAPLAGVIEKLSDAYTKINGADVNVKVKDPADAVRDLINDHCDMAVIERPLTTTEAEDFVKKHGYPPSAARLGMRGSIAIIVNKKNPLSALSIPQIDAIFSSKRLAGYGEDIATWGQLGIEDEEWNSRPITVVVPQNKNAGTDILGRTVLLGGELKPGLVEKPDAGAVIAEVAGNPFAIGLCRVEDVKRAVKAVPISASGAAVPPTRSAINQGQYPLTCYAYIYLARNPGWNAQRAMLSKELNEKRKMWLKKQPRFVVHTTREIDDKFNKMWNILNSLAEQLELNNMDMDRVVEKLIKKEIRKIQAKGSKEDPDKIREKLVKKMIKEFGSMKKAKKHIQGMLAESLKKTNTEFDDDAKIIRAKLDRKQDITVINLYEDLKSIYKYYWVLCDANQAALENFNPNGWQAMWLDRLQALRDNASKYTSRGGVRNIGKNKQIDKKMVKAVDELIKLRSAFLAELYEKHKTPTKDREKISAGTAGAASYASAFREQYNELRDIVTLERDKYLPSLNESCGVLEEKYEALRQYMAPYISDSGERATAKKNEIKTWLNENYYNSINAESDKAYKHQLSREFQDFFPNVPQLFSSLLITMTRLGRHYETIAAMPGKTRDERKNRESKLKEAELLGGRIKDMLANFRAMTEDRYDVEDLEIYTPDEEAYQERYSR